MIMPLVSYKVIHLCVSMPQSQEQLECKELSLYLKHDVRAFFMLQAKWRAEENYLLWDHTDNESSSLYFFHAVAIYNVIIRKFEDPFS